MKPELGVPKSTEWQKNKSVTSVPPKKQKFFFYHYTHIRRLMCFQTAFTIFLQLFSDIFVALW